MKRRKKIWAFVVFILIVSILFVLLVLLDGRVRLAVSSKPIGYELFIDSLFIGTTPIETKLLPGKHRASLKKGSKVYETAFVLEKPREKFIFDLETFIPYTEIIDGVKIDMIPVEGGCYNMGQPDPNITEIGCSDDEQPVHQVCLSDFYICKTEVTQALWEQLMETNPSKHLGRDFPVENITMDEIIIFLEKLNTRTGENYRLPTEAEWEYAARGGCKSMNYTYAGSDNLLEVGWFKANSDYETHETCKKKPNELGVYDMCGNVYELCIDYYKDDFYSISPIYNPVNDRIRTEKSFFTMTIGDMEFETYTIDHFSSFVERGGAYFCTGSFCRSCGRFCSKLDSSHAIGFRLAKSYK